MVFYAVANGRTIGIFSNWKDCNDSVKGYKNAIYKKFDTKEDAELFIQAKYNITETSKIISIENTIDFIPDYYVYTDGACSNNGKVNACAGIGIFFAINDNRNVSRKIDGKQTNNTAELRAIIDTYPIIENDIIHGTKITIVTDSEYAIKCLSGYGEKCYKQGWVADIPNKELVKQLYELYKDKSNVQFMHIKAHTNKDDVHSIGNDHADRLANLAIGLEDCPYHHAVSKIYLVVQFVRKDEIKKWGGLWDANKKKWFIYENNVHANVILNSFEKE
jgi:ribonuclease HI